MDDAATTYESAQPDPRGLPDRGIGLADCRSVFLDWVLGLADGQDGAAAAGALLAHYRDQPAEHPMSVVLREAAEGRARARRRGGASGRR